MEESPVSYKRHMFVCVNEKPEKQQCCGQNGGKEIFHLLREYLVNNGLFHTSNVSQVKCLGQCLQGPVVAIYPEGKIMVNVTKNDIKELQKWL